MNKSYTVIWNESKGCWSVAGESAKQRGKSSCSGVRAGVMAAVVLGLSALLPIAHAGPTGGTVTHGSASIWSNGGQTVINQSSPKAVIKWDSFGVDTGERVTFNQQRSDMALNYVSGTAKTTINGSLNAGGKIFIVNPNGIVFNAGSKVNVGGLVASTLTTDPASFFNNTNGEFVFEGGSTTDVLNRGVITANGGDVLLLGARPTNMGTIQSHLGTTALAAGQKVTVSTGSGLVKLEINAAAANALARNSGTIRADGGQVLLKARSSNASPLSTVVNNNGVIEAKTLNNVPGKIVLDGGTRGTVEVAGRLSATGLTSYGNGGSIDASGKNVRVRLGTTLDTRATNGYTGTFRLESDNVNVESTAASANPTIHADTLNRNLATTSIELASTAGDVVVKAPLSWTSGSSLTLNAKHGGAGKTVLNGAVSASGASSALNLLADERIDISDRIVLSGANARVALNTTTSATGTGVGTAKPSTANYRLRDPKANITLNGAGASFLSNNIYHAVIQNQAALQAVNNNLNGLYVLGTDMVAMATFESIGGAYGTFNGVFDGMGHTLGAFPVVSTGDNLGLFSSSAGIIRNLDLVAMNIKSANANVASASIGTLAGRNTGLIDNVNVIATTLNGNPYRANVVGGLVGTNQNGGIISNSTFSGSVRSSAYTSNMGGLVGVNRNNGTIWNSYASGTVSGVLQRNDLGGMGGLVGLNENGSILDSTSAVAVTANSANLNVGGLVGSNHNGSLAIVGSTGAVTGGASSNVGGLVGFNNGSITQADSTGQVSATSGGSVGGLVGVNNGGAISTASASGRVSSTNGANTGGLIGANNSGYVQDVRAANTVEDRRYAANIGGLVGYNGVGGSIQNGESSGKTVSSVYGNGGTRIGGLVGANNGNVFYGISNVERVSAGDYAAVGGLVGYNRGTIEASNSAAVAQGGVYSTTGGLVGLNAGSITGGTASGEVVGSYYATIGGLVGHNQEDGRVEHSTAEGRVTAQQGQLYHGTGMTLAGLVGVNQGYVGYSTSSGQVDFRRNLSQSFGGLAGINYGTMVGNFTWGQASQVPIVGINYGSIDMYP
ncbi:GLUG motif-containing protein [Achromobacter marplatensis]